MVARDEAVFRQFLSYNQFGLHAVGADLRHGDIFRLVLPCRAVAVHIERQLAVEDIRSVIPDTLLQSGQLCVIAAVRNIEHIPVGDEAESIDRITLLLRRQRQQK